MNFEDIRKKKNNLAKRCGSDTLEKLKIERYRESVKEAFELDDEVAMLKDVVFYMLQNSDFVTRALEDEKVSKFINYYLNVESKKTSVKEELGMLEEEV